MVLSPMTFDTTEIAGLVESALPALALLGGIVEWLSKQDAAGVAALITAALAILGSLAAAIKFLVGRATERTKGKQAARGRRTAALNALSDVGYQLLSDLEQGGDMGTAASEAREALSRPLAEANKFGIAEVTSIGERILATALQGDRAGLAQALGDLDALRIRLMR